MNMIGTQLFGNKDEFEKDFSGTFRKIRFGILGNAAIARNQMAPALLASEKCVLAGVASRSAVPDDVMPGVKRYASYEALLSDPEIDAVYIPVPNGLHKEWAVKAMRAGKHVLCEKPIAMNEAEAAEMFRVSEETGMLLMEAFMYRFSDKMKKAKALIKSGAVGSVRSIQVHHGYTLNWDSPARQVPALGGGSLYDVGCYCVSFIHYILDEEPVDLNAGFVMTDGGYDDHASVWMRFKSGAMATMESWFDAAGDQRALIVGTEGTLEIPGFPGGNADRLILKNGNGRQEIETEACRPYTLEADAFARAILGEETELIPKEETLGNMRTMDRIHAFRK